MHGPVERVGADRVDRGAGCVAADGGSAGRSERTVVLHKTAHRAFNQAHRKVSARRVTTDDAA